MADKNLSGLNDNVVRYEAPLSHYPLPPADRRLARPEADVNFDKNSSVTNPELAADSLWCIFRKRLGVSPTLLMERGQLP